MKRSTILLSVAGFALGVLAVGTVFGPLTSEWALLKRLAAGGALAILLPLILRGWFAKTILSLAVLAGLAFLTCDVIEIIPNKSPKVITYTDVVKQIYGSLWSGGALWAVNFDSPEVLKISRYGTVLAKFRNPKSSDVDRNFGICEEGGNLWVSCYSGGYVTKFDQAGKVLGTFPVGSKPRRLCLNGDFIWVVNSGDNTVTKLALDGRKIGTYPAGADPYGIVAADGSLWITNYGSANLTKLDSEGELVGHFPTGPHPMDLCFDGNNLWVAAGFEIYTGNIRKHDALSGREVGAFTLPGVITTRGKQLAQNGYPYTIGWDGRYVWANSFVVLPDGEMSRISCR